MSTLLDMFILWRDAFMTTLLLANIILRPKFGRGVRGDGGPNSHRIQRSPWPKSIPAEVLVHEVLLRKDWIMASFS